MRLLRFATFVLLFSFTAIVQAAFPDKPIKIIVGFPPGGPLDTHARLLIDQLQKNLGQPVIIDYKPGACGLLRFCRDLTQCLLEYLGWLAAGNQVLVVDDDRRH